VNDELVLSWPCRSATAALVLALERVLMTRLIDRHVSLLGDVLRVTM